MAITISTNGQKKIKTIQNEFNEFFSHLKIEFSTKPIIDDFISQKDILDNSKSLSEVRVKKGTSEISISGRKHVVNLESEFENIFGLYVKVYFWYFNKGKGVHYWLQTSDLQPMTLSERNELSKKLTIEAPRKDW